jgi:aminoethylphosphonate catabolism LysR family transcriptional regulator
MNLNHVMAFHRVAAAGSFTLAARHAGLSQPTLSAHVRDLEVSVGHPLFERSGRRIRLTPTGEALFAATQELERAISRIGDLLADRRDASRGLLRVSADSAVHAIPILAAMKAGKAGLAFSIRIDNSPAVLAHVLGEEADVGVMAKATADPRLHAERIREDRLVLLVSTTGAWAERRRVRLAELRGRDVVMREQGSITREVIEARLVRAKVAPGQVFEVVTREAVREAVAAGFGVGVVFASEAGSDMRVRAIEIADAGLGVSEYAVCRADRRHLSLVAAFLTTARRLAGEKGWLG